MYGTDAGVKGLVKLLGTAKPQRRGGQPAYTAGELAGAMGAGLELTRRRLRSALQAGEVKCVRVMRTDISGRLINIPAYCKVTKPNAK